MSVDEASDLAFAEFELSCDLIVRKPLVVHCDYVSLYFVVYHLYPPDLRILPVARLVI